MYVYAELKTETITMSSKKGKLLEQRTCRSNIILKRNSTQNESKYYTIKSHVIVDSILAEKCMQRNANDRVSYYIHCLSQ